MSDEPKSDSELKEELLKRAIKMGLESRVDKRWSAARIEDFLSKEAIERDQKAAKVAVAESYAPEPKLTKKPEGTLECRVTKKGDLKVHTGRPEKPNFIWKDIIYLVPDVAKALEERGYVEIEE